MKLKECDACGTNEWKEISRYFDFDGFYEKVSYACINCGHVYTKNAELTNPTKEV